MRKPALTVFRRKTAVFSRRGRVDICRRQIFQPSLPCFKMAKLASTFWTESILPECREVQLRRFSEGKWRRKPTRRSCNLPKASTRSVIPRPKSAAPVGRSYILATREWYFAFGEVIFADASDILPAAKLMKKSAAADLLHFIIFRHWFRSVAQDFAYRRLPTPTPPASCNAVNLRKFKVDILLVVNAVQTSISSFTARSGEWGGHRLFCIFDKHLY